MAGLASVGAVWLGGFTLGKLCVYIKDGAQGRERGDRHRKRYCILPAEQWLLALLGEANLEDEKVAVATRSYTRRGKSQRQTFDINTLALVRPGQLTTANSKPI